MEINIIIAIGVIPYVKDAMVRLNFNVYIVKPNIICIEVYAIQCVQQEHIYLTLQLLLYLDYA